MIFQDFNNRYSIAIYKQAETLQHVENRVYDLLNELRENPDQNVLIVSHGAVGLTFMSYFKGVPEDGNFLCFEIKHGKPEILDFNEISPSKEQSIEKN